MAVSKWILLIITTIYGSLGLMAGLGMRKTKEINNWSTILMILGGLMVVILPIFFRVPSTVSISLLIIALLMMQISAISNGIKVNGKFIFSHHIVRFIISILIVLAYGYV